jgi:hypothetical protein
MTGGSHGERLAYAPSGVILPFRWDLRRGQHIGGLLRDASKPDLWYWNALVSCAIKVIGRSAGGYVYFIGRSLDSVYDFLSGALRNTFMDSRLLRLPISCKKERSMSSQEARRFRDILAACEITPWERLSGRLPIVFCDTVDTGLTFTNLFSGLRAWCVEEGRWDVTRRKVRFVGVVRRNYPSPDVWRWYQHLRWTRQLPRSGFSSIAMDEAVWEYLTNQQPKTNGSFGPDRWGARPPFGPPRGADATYALAEANGVFNYGATPEVRRALARLLSKEYAMREPWLRRLVTELSKTAGRPSWRTHGRSGN